jgi:hypothetical protein
MLKQKNNEDEQKVMEKCGKKIDQSRKKILKKIHIHIITHKFNPKK